MVSNKRQKKNGRKNPPIHWYLVANRAGAVFYRGTPGKGMEFLMRIENPTGKLLETSLVSDRAGRGFSSMAGSHVRHGLTKEPSHHETAARVFAQDLGETLLQSVRAKKFTDLVVLAEPHFLGLIRKSLSNEVKARIREEIPREFAQGSDQELEEYLLQKLAVAS